MGSADRILFLAVSISLRSKRIFSDVNDLYSRIFCMIATSRQAPSTRPISR